MLNSNTRKKGNSIWSQVTLEDVVAAIASLGDRSDQLKSETWRLNSNTMLPCSLWGEVISKLGLANNESTRHALYDVWHLNRNDVQQLVKKNQINSYQNETDGNDECISTADQQFLIEEKERLIADPSLPLPARPNTRCNDKFVVESNENKAVVAEISLAFSAVEWKNSFSRTGQGMKDDWTTVFYSKLACSGITCAVKFKTPFIKKGKRKQNCRFFCCYAVCTIGECQRKYQIILHRQPDENSSVLFLVRIFGEENHDPIIATSARQLTGASRLVVGKCANEIGPVALYRELVDTANKDLLVAGNQTQCPTIETLKKAAADYRNTMRVDEDIFKTCRIISQVYRKEDKTSKYVSGYIHEIAEMPFRVHLYQESQIRRYIDYVKRENYSCIHIDATGGVLKQMRDQKQSLLYALIFKDGIDAGDTVPLAHAILNDHTVPSISYFFGKLAYHISEVDGKPVLPSFFIIDFSAATMNAVLQAFNVENINTHLNRCWNVIQCKYNTKELRSLSFIHLCCCHVIHAVARSFTGVHIDKKIRRSILFVFASALCDNDINRLYETFGNVIDIFGDPNEMHAKEKLEALINVDLNVDEDSKVMLKDGKKIFKEAKRKQEELKMVDEYLRSNVPIIHQSPFNVEAIRRFPILNNLVNHKTKYNKINNTLFSPSIIRIFYRWWAYLPLWTGLLVNFEERYSRDSSGNSPVAYHPVRFSNAVIESYFRTFKRSIRKEKRTNCPSDIIMDLHRSVQVQSKANEYGIKQSSKGRKRRKINAEEKWGKRPTQKTTRSAYFNMIDKASSKRKRTKDGTDRTKNIAEKLSESEQTTISSSSGKSTTYSEKSFSDATTSDSSQSYDCESTSFPSRQNSPVSSEYSTGPSINLDKPTFDDDRISETSVEFVPNGYTQSSPPKNYSTCMAKETHVTDTRSLLIPFDQPSIHPVSSIGTRKFRWPKFGVDNVAFEERSYSLTLSCSIDSALFCLYYIYETDVNVADELDHSTKCSPYLTLVKTFNYVKTEGWDVARIYWLRAFNILTSVDKQPKSLFGSVDEVAFQFLKQRQRHTTNIICSRSDCVQRERTCTSTEIDMFCSNEYIEKFEVERIGVCQSMMKRYDEITKAEAQEKKYKDGRLYTYIIDLNTYEYIQAWLCDSINVQSKATFVYDPPPILIVNVKPFSKKSEEGYEPTSPKLRDIKQKIKVGSANYQLRAVINHKNDHFTATLIGSNGTIYIFDDLHGVKESRSSTDMVEIAIYTKIYTFDN